jgi:hypothetical protein
MPTRSDLRRLAAASLERWKPRVISSRRTRNIVLMTLTSLIDVFSGGSGAASYRCTNARSASYDTRFGNSAAVFLRSAISASIASLLSTVPFSHEKPEM